MSDEFMTPMDRAMRGDNEPSISESPVYKVKEMNPDEREKLIQDLQEQGIEMPIATAGPPKEEWEKNLEAFNESDERAQLEQKAQEANRELEEMKAPERIVDISPDYMTTGKIYVLRSDGKYYDVNGNEVSGIPMIENRRYNRTEEQKGTNPVEDEKRYKLTRERNYTDNKIQIKAREAAGIFDNGLQYYMEPCAPNEEHKLRFIIEINLEKAAKGDKTLMGYMRGFIPMVLGRMANIAVLLSSKNYDYGNGNISMTGAIGIAVRLTDKASRIFNLVSGKKKAAVNEKIQDTWMDALGYSTIGLLEAEGKWEMVTSVAASTLNYYTKEDEA